MEVFEKIPIYVINLHNRKDKWISLQRTFEPPLQYFDFRRFNAIVHREGWKGCALSHISLVHEAYKKQDPFVIVFEDDIVPMGNHSSIHEWEKKLFESIQFLCNYNSWDICYLSCTFPKNLPFQELHQLNNTRILRMNYGLTTPALIYNNTSFKKIMQLRNFYMKNAHVQNRHAYDVMLNNIDVRNVIVYPFLAGQKVMFSDIQNKTTNYNYLYNDAQRKIEESRIIYSNKTNHT